MNYALFYNDDSNDIELYPKLENHSLSHLDIEQFLENSSNVEKWIIYDHLPTENDIEEFEKIIEEDELT